MIINTNFKLISDTIFNGVFLFLNLLFFIIALIFRIKKKKKKKNSIVYIPNNAETADKYNGNVPAFYRCSRINWKAV